MDWLHFWMSIDNLKTMGYCKFCDKEVNNKGLSLHLRKIHNIEFIDYVKDNLELFPTYHICPGCNEQICGNKINSKRPHTCSIECRGKIQSEYQQGRNIWNLMSEETKITAGRKIAEKASIRNKGIDPTSKWSEETKEQSRKKLSAAAKIRMKGSGNPMYGKTHTPEAIRRILQKRPKNKLETSIFDFLVEQKIEFYFQYFLTKDGTHSYDFKIKGIPLLIEIDGDYWHGGPGCIKYHKNIEDTRENDIKKTKMAESMGFSLIRFWQSEIQDNWDKVQNDILYIIQKHKKTI